MRNAFIKTSIVLFLSSCFLSVFARAAPPKLNYLVVKDLAVPFQISEGDQSKGGIVSDIVEAIAEDAEFQLHPIVGSTDRVYRLIKEAATSPWIAYDAKVWNALSPNGEILEEPVFEVTHSMATCNMSIPEIHSSERLFGYNIAILKTFNYPELRKLEKDNQITLTPVRNYRQGFALTEYHRADGFVEMSMRLHYNRKALQVDAECLRFLDVSALIEPYFIFLSVNKDMPAHMKNLILESLRKHKASGRVNQIVKRYTGH